MTSSISVLEARDAIAVVTPSYWRLVGHRLVQDRVTLFAGVLLAAIVLSAVFAPLLAPYDPTTGSIRLRLAPLGAPGHPPGTDEQGRDMLSRLLHGGRMTLLAGLTPIMVACLLGFFASAPSMDPSQRLARRPSRAIRQTPSARPRGVGSGPAARSRCRSVPRCYRHCARSPRATRRRATSTAPRRSSRRELSSRAGNI